MLIMWIVINYLVDKNTITHIIYPMLARHKIYKRALYKHANLISFIKTYFLI